jgi:outer membrane protein OmpA-like peptidoglycan-associated protein
MKIWFGAQIVFAKSGFLFLLLFLCMAFNSHAQEAYVKKGDALFSVGRIYEATAQYELAYENAKEDPELNYKLALCYLARSAKAKALEHANKAVNLSPSPTKEMYLALAKACHLNHKFDDAALNYAKADPAKTNFKQTSKWVKECEFGKAYVASPKDYKVTNAGALVNSAQPDYLPQITADLSRMYFTSRRVGSTGAKKATDELFFEDIYTALNRGGAWAAPENISTPINTADHDACVGLSEDGQTMFIYRGINGGDIYTSELKGNKWSAPVALPFNTTMLETSVSLSPDGRKLFFVRAATPQAQRDIYMASRTAGGAWSKPIKLAGINTEYDEESPFMHPDGKTLYFSSKGHSSMGGYDVFKSTLLSSGAWSAPENMGYPLNSADDDVFFVLAANGKVGYYSSDKEGGYGYQDIYSIRMPLSLQPKLTLLKGTIKDQNNGLPTEATITVTDNGTGEVVSSTTSNSATGTYLLALPADKNYGITIEKEGHLFYSENIYLSSTEGYKEQNKNITLLPATTGTKVVLKNIFFDVNQSTLKSESTYELLKLVKLLNENTALKLEISGHTDNTGDEAANKILSEQRAKAVVQFLVSKGVGGHRLVAKGYGSAQPIADNATEVGRQQNRRTEFKIL